MLPIFLWGAAAWIGRSASRSGHAQEFLGMRLAGLAFAFLLLFFPGEKWTNPGFVIYVCVLFAAPGPSDFVLDNFIRAAPFFLFEEAIAGLFLWPEFRWAWRRDA